LPSVSGPHQASPAELKERLEAERKGVAFLVLRDESMRQRIHPLMHGVDRLTIGRDENNDVCLGWDSQVSRVHARLELVGGHWTVEDDGLSRNGSYVDGERVRGRRRLADGSLLRFGTTTIEFHEPPQRPAAMTVITDDATSRPPTVSEAQRKVLLALCRPFREGAPFATPATNQAIAEELVLSLDAVKSHLRLLFQKFGVDELPPNQKRVRLVERAFATGAVSPSDL
jgi:predicted component of type VI protein secretion system